MTATECRSCGGPSTSLRYACPACRTATETRLGQIIDYTEMMSAQLRPSGRAFEPGPRRPGYSSRPPVSLDLITALDHRSHATGTGPDDDPDEATLSIVGSLHHVAAYVAEELYRAALMGSLLPRPLTVATLCSYLRVHTEWCCWQLWGADYVTTVRAIHAQARRQAHDAPPVSLGTCVEPDCGGTVWPVPGGGRCSNDPGHAYSGLHLARLAYTPQEQAS